MQRSCGPINREPSGTLPEVCRLPSFASYTPSEEPDTAEIGVEISNAPMQEVDSPVKNHRLKRSAVVEDSVTVTPGMYIVFKKTFNKNVPGLGYNRFEHR